MAWYMTAASTAEDKKEYIKCATAHVLYFQGLLAATFELTQLFFQIRDPT